MLLRTDILQKTECPMPFKPPCYTVYFYSFHFISRLQLFVITKSYEFLWVQTNYLLNERENGYQVTSLSDVSCPPVNSSVGRCLRQGSEFCWRVCCCCCCCCRCYSCLWRSRCRNGRTAAAQASLPTVFNQFRSIRLNPAVPNMKMAVSIIVNIDTRYETFQWQMQC